MPFDELSGVRAAVIGDFCLDTYWYADMTKSELSRETPHYPLPVVREIMSPGGAGNVAANLSALRIREVYALGVIGNDWRGACLKQALAEAGVDTSRLIAADGRFTNTYIKPQKYGYSGECFEDPRIDFEAAEPLDACSEEALLHALDEAAERADVICVCDQMRFGCVTERVRARLCALGAEGRRIVVDSRDRIGLYRNVIVKPNEIEARRAVEKETAPSSGKNEKYEKNESGCGEEEEAFARALETRTGKPAVVTCGPRGCIVCREGRAVRVPAFELDGKVDFCGAGDTFLSAFSAFLAAGAPLETAAKNANAASCVTVHKCGMTGTASREEIAAVLATAQTRR